MQQSGSAISATNTVLEHAALGSPGDVCVTALDWDVSAVVWFMYVSRY